MKHINELPTEIKLLLLSLAPELGSASREYYYLLKGRMPHALPQIELLPEDIKLRILWFAPKMRFASRNWYCLHNELYRSKCKSLDTERWTYKHMRLAKLVQVHSPDIEPLRRLCYSYHLRMVKKVTRTQTERSVMPFISDSWYFLYRNSSLLLDGNHLQFPRMICSGTLKAFN
ncbi:AaceriAAR114Wp [[Ashbya] aceris (nom. inval.)]|nr:AaceriAAR114Wp [[Ashbya] aceris (nom. inval.)]